MTDRPERQSPHKAGIEVSAADGKSSVDSTEKRPGPVDAHTPRALAIGAAICAVVKFETVTMRACTEARLDLFDHLFVETGRLPGDRVEDRDIRELLNAVAEVRHFAGMRERAAPCLRRARRLIGGRMP